QHDTEVVEGDSGPGHLLHLSECAIVVSHLCQNNPKIVSRLRQTRVERQRSFEGRLRLGPVVEQHLRVSKVRRYNRVAGRELQAFFEFSERLGRNVEMELDVS